MLLVKEKRSALKVLQNFDGHHHQNGMHSRLRLFLSALVHLLLSFVQQNEQSILKCVWCVCVWWGLPYESWSHTWQSRTKTAVLQLPLPENSWERRRFLQKICKCSPLAIFKLEPVHRQVAVTPMQGTPSGHVRLYNSKKMKWFFLLSWSDGACQVVWCSLTRQGLNCQTLFSTFQTDGKSSVMMTVKVVTWFWKVSRFQN